MTVARNRLDTELVRRGLATSRTQAREFIESRRVQIAKVVAAKPATQVETSVAIEVLPARQGDDYVSRGAHKLLGALKAFEGQFPPIAGATCLDAGASTGGFTEVLLRRGAAKVIAIDVGYGQLAWKIQNDPRVRVLDRTNVRYLKAQDIDVSPSIVVADLSFISLTLVLPALVQSCPEATMMLMVKPQFEAGKGRIGAGGVVRDPRVRSEAVMKVARCAIHLGLTVQGVAASPLPGPAGNVEYFLLLKPGPRGDDQGLDGTALQKAIEEAVEQGPSGERGSPHLQASLETGLQIDPQVDLEGGTLR